MKLFNKRNTKVEKPERFSFYVTQKIDYIDRQYIVLGKEKGHMSYCQQLYLIGPKGYHSQVKINKLIQTDEGIYGLVIDRDIGDDIDQGYIFTNHFVETTNDKYEVDNPYLHYLLYKVNHQSYDYLDDLLEELALRSNFISIFDENKTPAITVDQQKLYPLFSCYDELVKYQKNNESKNFVFSLSDYSAIVFNEEDLDGIIINPGSMHRGIVLNKDILKHIEKVKDKNLKDYFKMKGAYHKTHF